MADEKVTQTQPEPPKAPAEDREFAEWIGAAIQGKAKIEDPTLSHLVGEISGLQKQHSELSQRLAQGQQELLNARNELAKIEGRIEQAVGFVKHVRGAAPAKP